MVYGRVDLLGEGAGFSSVFAQKGGESRTFSSICRPALIKSAPHPFLAFLKGRIYWFILKAFSTKPSEPFIWDWFSRRPKFNGIKAFVAKF